jgi:hypothetical protein
LGAFSCELLKPVLCFWLCKGSSIPAVAKSTHSHHRVPNKVEDEFKLAISKEFPAAKLATTTVIQTKPGDFSK